MSDRPPLVLDESGNVLPEGSDFQSQQEQQLTSELVDKLPEDFKNKVRSDALETNFQTRQQVNVEAGQTDRDFMAGHEQKKVKPQEKKKGWWG